MVTGRHGASRESGGDRRHRELQQLPSRRAGLWDDPRTLTQARIAIADWRDACIPHRTCSLRDFRPTALAVSTPPPA